MIYFLGRIQGGFAVILNQHLKLCVQPRHSDARNLRTGFGVTEGLWGISTGSAVHANLFWGLFYPHQAFKVPLLTFKVRCLKK